MCCWIEQKCGVSGLLRLPGGLVELAFLGDGDAARTSISVLTVTQQSNNFRNTELKVKEKTSPITVPVRLLEHHRFT
jgi:hypothetical protein